MINQDNSLADSETKSIKLSKSNTNPQCTALADWPFVSPENFFPITKLFSNNFGMAREYYSAYDINNELTRGQLAAKGRLNNPAYYQVHKSNLFYREEDGRFFQTDNVTNCPYEEVLCYYNGPYVPKSLAAFYFVNTKDTNWNYGDYVIQQQCVLGDVPSTATIKQMYTKATKYAGRCNISIAIPNRIIHKVACFTLKDLPLLDEVCDGVQEKYTTYKTANFVDPMVARSFKFSVSNMAERNANLLALNYGLIDYLGFPHTS